MQKSSYTDVIPAGVITECRNLDDTKNIVLTLILLNPYDSGIPYRETGMTNFLQ